MATIARLPREIADTAEALVLMAAAAASTPFVGSRRRRWGATAEEAAGPMPGDELIPEPKWSYTYGITIHAPREDVWPWLAQIGQGRGGFYSYQTLENMFGCRIRNVDHIVPDLQKIEPGDTVRLHPSAPPLEVAAVNPPESLVLHGAPSAEQSDGDDAAVTTWQFRLDEASGGTTRLLARGRNDYGPGGANRLFFGSFPMEPVLFVMSRKMMLRIKQLAEAASA
jgi:hypothetical protein